MIVAGNLPDFTGNLGKANSDADTLGDSSENCPADGNSVRADNEEAGFIPRDFRRTASRWLWWARVGATALLSPLLHRPISE